MVIRFIGMSDEAMEHLPYKKLCSSPLIETFHISDDEISGLREVTLTINDKIEQKYHPIITVGTEWIKFESGIDDFAIYVNINHYYKISII